MSTLAPPQIDKIVYGTAPAEVLKAAIDDPDTRAAILERDSTSPMVLRQRHTRRSNGPNSETDGLYAELVALMAAETAWAAQR